MKIKDMKDWLEKNYPALVLGVEFNDLNRNITQADFDDFKDQMNYLGKFDVKYIDRKTFYDLKKTNEEKGSKE